MRIELDEETAEQLQVMGNKCNRSVNDLANLLLKAVVEADVNISIKMKLKTTPEVSRRMSDRS